MTQYRLYVPAADTKHNVRPGSAIVGDPGDGMIHTHYEGGGHSSNITTFEHRINQAAGRRIQRYPTSAQRGWNREDLIDVGAVSYDQTMMHWIIQEISDEKALRDWVGPDEPLVPEGSDQLIEEIGARHFSRLPVEDQARIMAMRLPMTALCAEVIATQRRLSVK